MPKFNVADKPTLDELYERMLHKGQYIGTEVGVNIPYALPYRFYNGSAVVLNDEIHILGGDYSTAPEISRRSHYKWDGLKWTSVSTIPFDFYHGSAVVFNNEIHIIGGNSSGQYHYKWDGINWISVSKPPISLVRGEAIVYNGQIRVCGTTSSSSYYAYSYIFDEKTITWNRTTNVSYNFYDAGLVEYQGYLYALGGGGSNTAFRRCTGLRWENVKDDAAKDILIPFNFVNGRAIVYKDKIHLLGSSSAAATYVYHYTWDGTTWTKLANLPYNFYNGDAVIYRDKIHILGSSDTTSVPKHKYHYQYDEKTDTWTNTSGDQASAPGSEFFSPGARAIVYNNAIHMFYKTSHFKFTKTGQYEMVSHLPFNFDGGSVVIFNNQIHLIGSAKNSNGFNTTTINHWRLPDETVDTWEPVATLPYDFYQGSAVVWDNKIHLLGGTHINNDGTVDVTTYVKKHFIFDGTTWNESTLALPYEFYHGTALVFNNEIHIFGSEHSSHYKKHYKFNGAAWVSVSTLPYNFYGGCVTIFNNELNLFSGYTAAKNATPSANHYKYDNIAKTWSSTIISLLPYAFGDGFSVEYQNSIHSFSKNINATDTIPVYNHHKFIGAAWIDTYTNTMKYKEYFLPKGCLIQCNPKNTNILGDVTYDEELQLYIVNSTSKIQIEALNDEGYLYNIL